MQDVSSGPVEEEDTVTLTMSRRDYEELVAVLREVEMLCESARKKAVDFRIARMRLEHSSLPSTLPPPPNTPRNSTRYVKLEDLPKKLGG